MTVLAKIRSFFGGAKAKAKAEEPKPTAAEAKKEEPTAPQKKA